MSKTEIIAEFIIKLNEPNNIIFVGKINKNIITNFIKEANSINNNINHVNISVNDFLKLKFNYKNPNNILFINNQTSIDLFNSILTPQNNNDLDTIIFKNIADKLFANSIIASIKNINHDTLTLLTKLLDMYPHEFNYFINHEFIAIQLQPYHSEFI